MFKPNHYCEPPYGWPTAIFMYVRCHGFKSLLCHYKDFRRGSETRAEFIDWVFWPDLTELKT